MRSKCSFGPVRSIKYIAVTRNLNGMHLKLYYPIHLAACDGCYWDSGLHWNLKFITFFTDNSVGKCFG